MRSQRTNEPSRAELKKKSGSKSLRRLIRRLPEAKSGTKTEARAEAQLEVKAESIAKQRNPNHTRYNPAWAPTLMITTKILEELRQLQESKAEAIAKRRNTYHPRYVRPSIMGCDCDDNH